MAYDERKVREASAGATEDGSGPLFDMAVKTIAAQDFPVYFMGFGDGTAEPTLASAANPLPVTIGNFPSGFAVTQSGVWVITASDLDIRNLAFSTDKVDASGSSVLESTGTFSYESTTLTSGSLSVTGRVINYRVFATVTDGTFNIDGGDTITVRQDTGFDWSPRSPLVDPEFFHVSGTLDLFVEVST